MKNRPRGGLGRGLGALIPTGPARSSAVTSPVPPSQAGAPSSDVPLSAEDTSSADTPPAEEPPPVEDTSSLVARPAAQGPPAAGSAAAGGAAAGGSGPGDVAAGAEAEEDTSDGVAADSAATAGPVAAADAHDPADGADAAPRGGAAVRGAAVTVSPESQPATAGEQSEVLRAAGAPSSRRRDGDVPLAPVPGAAFAEIAVAAIVPNPRQPRQVFDDELLEELKTSIREVGFLQPIVVREIGPERYELIMGERRWRAAQAIGRTSIPAIIRETGDDAMLRDALLENIHRAQLNPLEEAAAYQQLLDEFGATHEELAKRIGRSRPQITNTIRLMNLPAKVQRRVAAGVLSAGHARALLSLDDPTDQEEFANRIVGEGLSVRATEELVSLALADGPKPAPAKRRTRPTAPALSEWADRLSERFDTRVKVDLGRSKGKIVIEFASVADLERIARIMDVAGGDAADE